MATKAFELEPTSGSYWNTLGAAHYRAGNWQDAIAALNKSVELDNGGTSSDWLFLSMSYWQLDNKDAARKWYAKAVDWMDRNKSNDQLLIRLRTEAGELLKKETAVTDQEPEKNRPEALPAAPDP